MLGEQYYCTVDVFLSLVKGPLLSLFSVVLPKRGSDNDSAFWNHFTMSGPGCEML